MTPPSTSPAPPRLFDFDIPWLRQYAPELSSFDSALTTEIPAKRSLLDGYLTDTAAAVIALDPLDLTPNTDPWRAVANLLAQTESEFAGRIFATPDDLRRFEQEPDQLCWALPRIDALGIALHAADAFNHLAPLIHRGVRAFGWSERHAADPPETADPETLITLLTALHHHASTVDLTLAIDFAHASPAERQSALLWFETHPTCATRLIPIVSRANVAFEHPALDEIARWRALGAYLAFSLVTLASEPTATVLAQAINAAAAIPSRHGLGLSTSFLRAGTAALPNVAGAQEWLNDAFPHDDSVCLAAKSGHDYLRQMFTGSA